METLVPNNEAELCDLIREDGPVDIEGFGSKRQLGRPGQSERVISTRSLNGILNYEPDEMVISMRAGTPLQDIQDALGEQGQRLAFEPPNWFGLYNDSAQQSIGGIVACNHSGSRRLSAGACRDHVLGFKAVNGLGEVFQSGGRVVKNVTGYDLPKLMTGSFGTLGVFTEITLRSVPIAATETTLMVPGIDAGRATALLSELMGGPWELTAAAWLPAVCSKPLLGHDDDGIVIRLEGFSESVAQRLQGLRQRHALGGELLDQAAGRALWQAIGDAQPMHNLNAQAIWRVSVPPASGARMLSINENPGWMDWAGGLVWLSMADEDDAGAHRLRSELAKVGGHATLVKACEERRRTVDVFQPAPAARAKLEERIRQSFDPQNRLNPGRMHR